MLVRLARARRDQVDAGLLRRGQRAEDRLFPGAWLFAERLLYVDWIEERAMS